MINSHKKNIINSLVYNFILITDNYINKKSYHYKKNHYLLYVREMIISNDSSIIIGVRFLVHRISVSSLEIL